MKPCVIALSSLIGAGKSTIARELSERLGWPRVSFGDYVREIARNRGLEESRVTLQELGESLVQNDAEGFTHAVLSKINFNSGAVVDGIRHKQILDALARVVDPLAVHLIYVETGEQTRFKRLSERGMTPADVMAADAHSTEVQVRGVLSEGASLYARGDGNTGETADMILEWLNGERRLR
jgi:cytidylate kinase